MFEITMGSHNGEKNCEIVGLCMLNQLDTVIDKRSVGLCKDDKLAAINNWNGLEFDKIRKYIITLFKEKNSFNHHQSKSYWNRLFRCYLQLWGR